MNTRIENANPVAWSNYGHRQETSPFAHHPEQFISNRTIFLLRFPALPRHARLLPTIHLCSPPLLEGCDKRIESMARTMEN